MLRIGLVGAGKVGIRHARVLSGLAGVRVTGVVDVLPEAATRLAAECGARVHGSVADLIAAGPDAVYVCVPPFAHGPVERAVIEAGLPMFVEKPIALDDGTAGEIAELVAARGVRTAVGHHWRYMPTVEHARELLAGRAIQLVMGTWLDTVAPPPWWLSSAKSGGQVMEQAVHILDLARCLGGEVDEVFAYGSGRPPAPHADVDGATVATLRFAGGAVGTLSTTCVLDWRHEVGLEIYADGLALALTDTELVIRENAGTRVISGDQAAARVTVDQAFVDAVRGVADDIRVPYAEARRTHGLALAVAESTVTRRPVRLRRVEAANV